VIGEADWATLPTRVAGALAMTDNDTEGNKAVKVHIDPERCQGHGRCYDLVPGLFADDEEGYGQVIGDGVVPPGQEGQARLAAANCPERAIELLEETGHDR